MEKTSYLQVLFQDNLHLPHIRQIKIHAQNKYSGIKFNGILWA